MSMGQMPWHFANSGIALINKYPLAKWFWVSYFFTTALWVTKPISFCAYTVGHYANLNSLETYFMYY